MKKPFAPTPSRETMGIEKILNPNSLHAMAGVETKQLQQANSKLTRVSQKTIECFLSIKGYPLSTDEQN